MKVNLETSSSDAARIELIPLIDVVFCILIFFILAAVQLTRQQAISVDLPAASTATYQNQQILIVSIDALGQIYIDRTPVSDSQLYLYLEGYNRTNPSGLMVLYVDRNAIYADVITVLDLMRSVGGDRVALATLPPNADAQSLDPTQFQPSDPQDSLFPDLLNPQGADPLLDPNFVPQPNQDFNPGFADPNQEPWLLPTEPSVPESE